MTDNKICKEIANQYRDMVEDSYHDVWTKEEVVDILESIIDENPLYKYLGVKAND